MEIRPILSTLRKHRIPAILIVLEIAVSCAVLCNAIFLIGQRLSEMHASDAIDESGLTVIRMTGTDPKLAAAQTPRNLAALRSIPGVKAVAAFNKVPLSYMGGTANVWNKPESNPRGHPNVVLYMFTQGGANALGMRLMKGRLFRPDEFATSKTSQNFLPTTHVTLITQSLAARLWPGQDAVGKKVWVGTKHAFTVVGVVADVLRTRRSMQGGTSFHWCMFLPVSTSWHVFDYVARSAPDDRGRILRQGVKKFQALAPNAIVRGRLFSTIRANFFATNRSMIWILVLVCVVMLAVTAFGIVGLSSFWVRQRRHQIGIRRAVGGTRRHILQYFQVENFLLSTAGIVLGMILAFGINLYLMQHYQLDRMPWFYLPTSAVALWILGQLAVLGPALRASRVPPVVATRSV